MARTRFLSWVMRLVGLCILLVGLGHFAAILDLTPLGRRSNILFTLILFGSVLTPVGVWLLRGDFANLFRPSKYDVVVGLIAFPVLAYFVSWLPGGISLWRLVARHPLVSVDHMWQIVGIGFLAMFAVASLVWIAHVIVLCSSQLRDRFRPMPLSHLAAALLLLPSLRLGSQLPVILRFLIPGHPGI